MKVLSEETGVGDVATRKKCHRTSLFLDERIQRYVLTGKKTIHFVLKEMLHKNFPFITAVTLFMKFFA
jgi:hypothetical protein